MIKNVLYMRSGPYKPDINMYNMQELGFAKALLKRDVSTDVMYFSDQNKIEVYRKTENAQIRIIWEKGYKILRTGIYPQMLNYERLSKYDLIILTEFSQIMTYLVSRRHNNCVLYTGPYYNLFKLPFVEPIYDALFTKSIDKNIKQIYTKSKLATEYMARKGYHNLTTLGVGLDTEKFEREKIILPETTELIEKMRRNKCLLYVGSLIDRKNFVFTLKVFEVLKTQYHLDYKMVIIGKGKKNYVDSSFAMISNNSRQDIIHVEKIPNAQLKYIYPLADFFLFPSKLEIFGMVMLEAMFFGNVVITSKNGGSSVLIDNMNNGVSLDGFVEGEWAQVINSIIESGNLDEIKCNAKNTIKNGFLWDSIVDRFFKKIPGD